MSIKKRGETWHIDIVAPDGSRVRRSTGTTEKRKALEYHDKLKAELWDVSRLINWSWVRSPHNPPLKNNKNNNI